VSEEEQGCEEGEDEEVSQNDEMKKRASSRRSRKPTSYKEPSLNAKIRKGHKFFTFT